MPYRYISATVILIVLCVLHAFAISKGKRNVKANQVEKEEASDIIYEEKAELNLTCRAFCNAEWKNNFEAYFQLSYNVDFSELPLHPVLTSNLDDFERYCNLTEELLACLSDQCDEKLSQNDWTPGIHLCIYQKSEFIDVFDCMNLTSALASKNCHRHCEATANASRNSTRERVEAVQLNFTEEEATYFSTMTFQCHYEFCLLGCQNKLIERYCSKRERGQAIELLTDYVTGKIEHTLRALEDVGKELLFPGFCHRLLPECYGFASTDNNSDSRFDPAIQLLSSSNDSMAKEGAI